MIVVDAGPLAALADADDPLHDRVRGFIRSTDEPFVLSPFVLAEVDYLVNRLCGLDAQVAMLTDVRDGLFGLDPISDSDVRSCLEIINKYRDLNIGIADASVVVLAHRHRTINLLTFDERHFRTMRSLSGEPFVILPADQTPRKR